MTKWEYGVEFDPVYAMTTVRSISSEGRVIAHVNCAFGDGEENAKLIAAVPDLIETLQGLLAELETYYMEGNHRVVDARKALAKAGVK